jgi:hypothetical protein
MEYNRLLKQNASIYIEVPAPDCDRKHENNPNHYSILGSTQLAALLVRTGFDIEKFNNIEFDLTVGQNDEGEPVKAREKYYAILATKRRPLDVK